MNRSLLRKEWAVPVCAALVAIALPVWLISSKPVAVPATEQPVGTRFEVRPPPMLEAALAKPAFSPLRLPAGSADPTIVVADSAGSGAPRGDGGAASSPSPKLVGIAVARSRPGVALFRQADGKTVTVKRGELVDGWTIIAIGRDSVGIALGNELKTERIHFPGSSQQTAGTATSQTSEAKP